MQAPALDPRALTSWLPDSMRETALLRLFGLAKIPMLFFARPRVVELTDARTDVVIPLSRITRNHLGSMYFGVLAMGADCAGALIAMRQIDDRGGGVSLIFGEFHAKFLQRAEGDVHFVCTEGEAIRELVQRAFDSDERVSMPVHVTALVPTQSDKPVAEFELMLSLKKKRARPQA